MDSGNSVRDLTIVAWLVLVVVLCVLGLVCIIGSVATCTVVLDEEEEVKEGSHSEHISVVVVIRRNQSRIGQVCDLKITRSLLCSRTSHDHNSLSQHTHVQQLIPATRRSESATTVRTHHYEAMAANDPPTALTVTTSTSNNNNESKSTFLTKIQQHPFVSAGAGVALLVHLSALLSLPPVIRSRGAPFLPTSKKHGNAMFEQLQQELLNTKSPRLQQKLQDKALTFVDLGSGDGRLVFRAARQGIFQTSIGYEINPVLHVFAHSRRLLQAPQYWNKTRFRIQDIWKVNLGQVDVVAVYGLTPIMKPLGVKLQKELPVGSIVLSNVFSIPGWQPESTSRQGTHVYVVPEKKKEEPVGES